MKQKESRLQFPFTEEYEQGEHITSFSQLELRVSIAIGLLGALLPVPGGMTWSPGWFGHGKLRAWLACLFARVVERYCFTCCRWACWMWYLVGFSRWVCTCMTQFKKCFIVVHPCYQLWHDTYMRSTWAMKLWHTDQLSIWLKYKPVQLQGRQQRFANPHSVARNQFMT